MCAMENPQVTFAFSARGSRQHVGLPMLVVTDVIEGASHLLVCYTTAGGIMREHLAFELGPSPVLANRADRASVLVGDVIYNALLRCYGLQSDLGLTMG
jgi:hypothetical protein